MSDPSPPTVWTFFYGSFINLRVLADVGFVPGEVEVARLNGYRIRIEPLANLERSDRGACAWGILARATHDELDRLYDYARVQLGGTYLPEAVLCETRSGHWRPALCYIAHQLRVAPAAEEYIERVVQPARELGFPEEYVRLLESFRPGR